MSGPLAFVGGAEWTDGCTFDRVLLAWAGASKVTVLPTAAAFENRGKYLERARQWFGGLGAEVEVLEVYGRGEALDESNVEQARKAAFIYICDGGSMHLRSVLKDSPLWDAIVEAWNAGAVLAASGAGADVLSDPMVDPRGGAFTVGLGLVRRMSVIPRFDTWSREKVHRTVELAPPDVVVVGIPRGTALMRSADGSWSADGVGEIEVFVAGKPADLSALESVTFATSGAPQS